MTLCRFWKGLNDDLKREVVFKGMSTLDEAYTLVQNYESVIKSQWIGHQVTYSIRPRSQPNNNNSLLGDSPRKPNLTISQMPRKDKGKVIPYVTSNMTSRIQCIKCQGFVSSCPNNVLFITDREDIGEEDNCDNKVYEPNPDNLQNLNDEEEESNLLGCVRSIFTQIEQDFVEWETTKLNLVRYALI